MMRRFLLRNVTPCTRHLLNSSLHPKPTIPNPSIAVSTPTRLRFYSESSNNAPPDALHGSSALAELKTKDDSNEVKDVSNKELREMIDNYSKGNGEVLPSIMEAILQRKLSRKHEETDDELTEELRMKPLSDVDEEEFQSDFDELYETDKELNDLCDAKEYVVKKMMQDQYFNMDDKKWDEMVKEAMDHGFIKDTKECEEILEDMLSWDKLLPDDIKEKVEKKFNELGDMCERGELEAEEAYELFKKFEDEMVMEYVKKMEAEGPPQFDEAIVPDKKKHSDDPPGEGPILRWQTRVVFAPGGDAWHPKNRKVKMSVTVKELGLSKPQFRRLRELVGKRYHPGRDELTITSERFEHREENRKDCLRTLFALIEEAGKATKLAEETRVSYCKDRLRANPAFMERLHSKIMRQGSNTISA
ncbi:MITOCHONDRIAL 28S RIBOSOMAL PROTEIN S28 [Salix koriyanagi]|uniref:MITOCHONDRIAL 28S RIBOSOMAL PROTEIN S28 n=1 Tax=Salix koriyanagi TaxID=2511006 RepID=A0A9Q0PGG8_9ROSI|nr:MITOCHONDRIAL 28S RIBOSOMAL PROTEIN S28 [Salix koriyanagi]